MEPRVLRAFAAAVLLAAACVGSWGLGFFDAGSPSATASRLVGAMSDDELLGQVFFLGYQGVGPSPDILRWISERNLGGVKLFPRNVSDLASLARDVALMQRLAARNRLHIPLFIATDQEGGWVRQIKDETSISPGNLAWGRRARPRTPTRPAGTSEGSSPRWASTWTLLPRLMCTRIRRQASSVPVPSAPIRPQPASCPRRLRGECSQRESSRQPSIFRGTAPRTRTRTAGSRGSMYPSPSFWTGTSCPTAS